ALRLYQDAKKRDEQNQAKKQKILEEEEKKKKEQEEENEKKNKVIQSRGKGWEDQFYRQNLEKQKIKEQERQEKIQQEIKQSKDQAKPALNKKSLQIAKDRTFDDTIGLRDIEKRRIVANQVKGEYSDDAFVVGTEYDYEGYDKLQELQVIKEEQEQDEQQQQGQQGKENKEQKDINPQEKYGVSKLNLNVKGDQNDQSDTEYDQQGNNRSQDQFVPRLNQSSRDGKNQTKKSDKRQKTLDRLALTSRSSNRQTQTQSLQQQSILAIDPIPLNASYRGQFAYKPQINEKSRQMAEQVSKRLAEEEKRFQDEIEQREQEDEYDQGGDEGLRRRKDEDDQQDKHLTVVQRMNIDAKRRKCDIFRSLHLFIL
ncbi:MAG: hypothetical protein EZS28_048374, partial [Streblomastix strix]